MQGNGFSRLIDLSATRLDIARKVVLTKWDTRQAIEDTPRENVVIAEALEEATHYGLAPSLVKQFFADQIEANKLVQYGLLAAWRRNGGAPAEPRADLKGEIRPALDKLQTSFIVELAATTRLRAEPDCVITLAKATKAYVDAHRLDPLYEVALERGLARVCAP